MTLTVREKVLAAFKAKLDLISDVTVYRNRDVEISSDKMPAINMIDGGHGGQYDSTAIQRIDLPVTIECYTKAETDELLGPAISELYGQVTLQVMSDITLGGLAQEVAPGDQPMSDPVIAREKNTPPHAAFELNFVITFFVNPLNPYLAA